MKRIIVSVFVAATITLSLLVFMTFLVDSGKTFVSNTSEKAPVITISMVKKETKLEQKNRVLPDPPTNTVRPKIAITQVHQSNIQARDIVAPNIDFSLSNITIGQSNIGRFSLANMLIQDGEATPIVRIEPNFPMQALREGKEGYVKLSFSINQIGRVEDIQIIDAKPRRLFNKEAKRALKRWKYKPKMINGKAVKQRGLTVQLDFKLRSAS